MSSFRDLILKCRFAFGMCSTVYSHHPANSLLYFYHIHIQICIQHLHWLFLCSIFTFSSNPLLIQCLHEKILFSLSLKAKSFHQTPKANVTISNLELVGSCNSPGPLILSLLCLRCKFPSCSVHYRL